jgi:hypothetical protein
LQPLLEARRERSAPLELFFQSRRQTVFFGKPWRKVVLVTSIPFADDFTVLVLVIAFALVVFVSVLFVAFSVTLSQCKITAEYESSEYARTDPSR